MVKFGNYWGWVMPERFIIPMVRSSISITAGILLSILLFGVTSILGSKYEGVMFPVVSKLEVEQVVEEKDKDSILVWAVFNKVRECKFVGVAWYVEGGLGVPDYRIRYEPNPDIEDSSDTNRPTGVQRAGPWRLYVSKQLFETGVYSVLTHQCNPFYMTKTYWYP